MKDRIGQIETDNPVFMLYMICDRMKIPLLRGEIIEYKFTENTYKGVP